MIEHPETARVRALSQPEKEALATQLREQRNALGMLQAGGITHLASITITENDVADGEVSIAKLLGQVEQKLGRFAWGLEGLRSEFAARLGGRRVGDHVDISDLYSFGLDYSTATTREAAHEAAASAPWLGGGIAESTAISMLAHAGYAPEGFGTEGGVGLALEAQGLYGLGGLGRALLSKAVGKIGDALTRNVLRSAGDFPPTGISSLDAPAVNSSSFGQKMETLERSGIKVTADADLAARGEFTRAKDGAWSFAYNPRTMTRLDLAHEWRHFQQLVKLEESGLAYRAPLRGTFESGAYAYEQRLWRRIGGTPTQAYLAEHGRQVAHWLAALRGRDVHNLLRYNPEYRSVWR
jgi:hypothetical protein